MRTNMQQTAVIAVVVIAIVVFGAFILLNMSDRPVNQPDATSTAEATAEADTVDATAEVTAETTEETSVTEESTTEATESVDSTEEATAESTESADTQQGVSDTATDEPDSPAEATPTSVSRVQESIAAEGEVTPALESTSADDAQSSDDGTPTSASRVSESILIGTQVTPVLQSTVANDNTGSSSGTPTSVSRVQRSIILGADSTQEAEVPAAQPPTESTPAPDVTAESTSEATAESTAEAEATAETTEQAVAIGTGEDDYGRPSASIVLSGAQDSPSVLQPQGPVARYQANHWWIMAGLGLVIYVVVIILVAMSFMRHRQEINPAKQTREEMLFIIGGGVVLPLAVIALLFGLTLSTMSVLAVSNQPTDLTVRVIGKQWWWEVEYPDYGFTTANEIHIPAGVPVRFELTSDNVIHSFWVPELGGKMDLIPKVINVMWLQADSEGIFRGQCAEYCGIQHAKMALLVIAENEADFNRWVEHQQQPALEPESELAIAGQEVFLNSECIACHTVRGTNAAGVQGPELTHVGSRLTLAAATIPNARGHMAGWIVDSQSIKPGNLMPPQDIPGEDLQLMLAYLESLK